MKKAINKKRNVKLPAFPSLKGLSESYLGKVEYISFLQTLNYTIYAILVCSIVAGLSLALDRLIQLGWTIF